MGSVGETWVAALEQSCGGFDMALADLVHDGIGTISGGGVRSGETGGALMSAAIAVVAQGTLPLRLQSLDSILERWVGGHQAAERFDAAKEQVARLVRSLGFDL